MPELMSMWARCNVDFRYLISFKNNLFDSPELDPFNRISLQEYRRIRNEHDNAKIKNEVSGTDHMILNAITCEDNSNMVELNKFADLVDLYVYHPVKEAIKNMQKSP
mmetsp:Transcript_24000/g.29837  ORF Transcript_24000/g.29837 Transcript_24000/m.29837 type:complete len:107 (+) Transcript_24000:110-430(+)|eukprot:CAMPEP_0170454304 /NCGR_PEP_ID=MMETSP0123-20130129/2608_1 /TAXON_ID=182087 /ORGANISM="Favella ehrenbergii, Strain Fehren 1" /LENGTH=106 /DNA_ID=CAMNT_0010716987 /DNA_START=1035 /DNA_END=1355 /DNA_ORIENTATION=+